jgi:NAD(P)-dependent dehydrogenase (short-subunit alcohol dehydrogenase family)
MRVIITGTSRGIGLELAQNALHAGHELLAVARQPARSAGLTRLASQFGERVRIVAADLREPAAAGTIAAAVPDREAVDVLVNNAGILRQRAGREDFMESFTVNAVAPFELTCALLPLLKKSAQPRVVHITSKMGSIADNGSGGYYAYRASKSALNMINMSLARDHAWLTTVVVHPGWVQTDMGGAEAPVTPAQSATGIWQLISGLKQESSGRFFDYQGQPIPW